jgi:SNF family Na+-dependent transporter
LTLPGIGIGLKYLFYPNFWKLLDLNVWIKACNQVVYVLNIGMGGNIIFSSYRSEKEDIYYSSFWLPMLTILFGVLCAIINFSYLGHFSYIVNIPIEKLPLSGTDLAFVTYPSALCMLPFPNFWAIIFFFILITLGIDSQVILILFIFRIIFILKVRFLIFLI